MKSDIEVRGLADALETFGGSQWRQAILTLRWVLGESSMKLSDPARKSRAGRKAMTPEERREVSERMSAFWANKRADAAEQRRLLAQQNGAPQ